MSCDLWFLLFSGFSFTIHFYTLQILRGPGKVRSRSISAGKYRGKATTWTGRCVFIRAVCGWVENEGASGRGSLRSHFKASHSESSRSICFSDCIYSDDLANNGLSLISLFSFIHPPPHSTAGPRNCIGQRFALLEEKSIISAIVRKFKIKSVQKREDIKLLQEIVLRPLDGIHLQFQRRQWFEEGLNPAWNHLKLYSWTGGEPETTQKNSRTEESLHKNFIQVLKVFRETTFLWHFWNCFFFLLKYFPRPFIGETLVENEKNLLSALTQKVFRQGKSRKINERKDVMNLLNKFTGSVLVFSFCACLINIFHFLYTFFFFNKYLGCPLYV